MTGEYQLHNCSMRFPRWLQRTECDACSSLIMFDGREGNYGESLSMTTRYHLFSRLRKHLFPKNSSLAVRPFPSPHPRLTDFGDNENMKSRILNSTRSVCYQNSFAGCCYLFNLLLLVHLAFLFYGSFVRDNNVIGA